MPERDPDPYVVYYVDGPQDGRWEDRGTVQRLLSTVDESPARDIGWRGWSSEERDRHLTANVWLHSGEHTKIVLGAND